MQDTLEEWRRAPGAKSCQGCHMDRGSHRFPGGHDQALLRATVSATVRQLGDGRLRAELRATSAGHRVPTGDPFRRLTIELCEEPSCAAPLAGLLFGRAFRKTAESWALARDTAIPPPAGGTEARRALDLTPEPGPPARYWRLLYGYAAPSSEKDLSGDDVAVEVLRGSVMGPR